MPVALTFVINNFRNFICLIKRISESRQTLILLSGLSTVRSWMCGILDCINLLFFFIIVILFIILVIDCILLFCRNLILFLEELLRLPLGLPLLLDLLLLQPVLCLPFLNPLTLSLPDLFLALVNERLVLVVERALASGLNVYHEQLVILLECSLCQMVAVNNLTTAIHNETLLDLRIARTLHSRCRSRDAWPDHWTHVVLTVQVGLLVGCQVWRLRKPFIAARIGTKIGFLTSMSTQMSP